MEIAPISASKLVVEEAGKIVFTVATMRLWFAAQALRKGWVDETKLVGDLPRARYWQQPLGIFIASTDFESAARYFEPLASGQPAIAAQVITSSTSQWGKGTGRPPSEFEAFAKRTQRCLQAWLQGISPMERVCGFTDQYGSLLKLRAGYSAPDTIIAFSHDRSLPEASALPSDWGSGQTEQFHVYKEPDEPSHLWRQTYSMVREDLVEFLERQRWELVDSALFHEEAWNLVTGLSQTPRIFARSVPWTVINKFETLFRRRNIWNWLCEKRTSHPDALPAPHPPADIQGENLAWFSEMFSPMAALARAHSTYGMALAAYQRIVTTYFPRFQNDLHHSAWWPCRIIGKVGGGDRPAPGNRWWITYHCEPVISEKEAIVTLELGTNEREAWHASFEANQEKARQLRPKAPPWFWVRSTVLNLEDTHPASVIVRRWLIDDFGSAGWKP